MSADGSTGPGRSQTHDRPSSALDSSREAYCRGNTLHAAFIGLIIGIASGISHQLAIPVLRNAADPPRSRKSHGPVPCATSSIPKPWLHTLHRWGTVVCSVPRGQMTADECESLHLRHRPEST